VVIADIAEESAEDAARSLGADHLGCDVTDRGSVQRLVDTVVERHGRLDIMVANAGIAGGAPCLELTDERWDDVIAVNLRGVFLCDQIAGRQFVQQADGRGAIVNTASILAARANPTTAAYSASKAGVVSLTHSAAAALGPYGVRVNAIGPGYIETQMTAGIRADAAMANQCATRPWSGASGSRATSVTPRSSWRRTRRRTSLVTFSTSTADGCCIAILRATGCNKQPRPRCPDSTRRRRNSLGPRRTDGVQE
jgi:NAD(P)-dependent dehydrogenase (short-subunit alcohol dehydrogenase family)